MNLMAISELFSISRSRLFSEIIARSLSSAA
jgi:hypothetical protein